MSENHKKQAAFAALDEIKSGMRIGLGTGSTAEHFVDYLGARVAEGLECICVPTSERTAAQAKSLNIPLSDLETLDQLDVTIDGADEIGPDLALIKGAGGALLREKIVAHASKRMVVISDASKRVSALGAFPLPIEVNPFGIGATKRALAELMKTFKASGELVLRQTGDRGAYVTDGGHNVFDASFGRISDAKALSSALLEIPGIVQHGLFIDLCVAAYVAGPDGVDKLEA